MNFYEFKSKQWDDRVRTGLYVTDTSLSDICNYHKIDLSNISSVLVIGVGGGSAISELVQQNKIVYASDISLDALEIAKNHGAKLAIGSNDIRLLPPVDLVIAHLVLQHNIEPEVQRLINDVNLAENGYGSYQFSYLTEDCFLTIAMIRDLNNGELNFISPERASLVIERTNKLIVDMFACAEWRNATYSWNWGIVKFTNKSTT